MSNKANNGVYKDNDNRNHSMDNSDDDDIFVDDDNDVYSPNNGRSICDTLCTS